jgi:DNA-directed RNA polymerase specialized sigma24 family protein
MPITDVELASLVRRVTWPIRSRDPDDVYQSAYLAALQAVRSAEEHGSEVSVRFVRLAAQKAAYRETRKSDVTVCESIDKLDQTGDGTERVLDSEEASKRLARLTTLQRRTLEAYYRGERVVEIAAREGVLRTTVYERIKAAIKRLRGDE